MIRATISSKIARRPVGEGESQTERMYIIIIIIIMWLQQSAALCMILDKEIRTQRCRRWSVYCFCRQVPWRIGQMNGLDMSNRPHLIPHPTSPCFNSVVARRFRTVNLSLHNTHNITEQNFKACNTLHTWHFISHRGEAKIRHLDIHKSSCRDCMPYDTVRAWSCWRHRSTCPSNTIWDRTCCRSLCTLCALHIAKFT